MTILGNNSRSQNYIGTFQGFFTKKVPEGTPNAVTRTNKEGASVTEIQFTSLSATLTDIKEKEGKFGKAYQFIFQDETESVCLESQTNSGLTSAIINRLPALDLLSPFDIEAKWVVKDGKGRVYYNIYQGSDEAIKDFFQEWDEEKKEWNRLHGFPSWEQIEHNGELVWDASKQMAYQKKVVDKYFGFDVPRQEPVGEVPDHAKVQPTAPPPEEEPIPSKPEPEDDGMVDDLPF
jgi:hypothetical protein